MVARQRLVNIGPPLPRRRLNRRHRGQVEQAGHTRIMLRPVWLPRVGFVVVGLLGLGQLRQASHSIPPRRDFLGPLAQGLFPVPEQETYYCG
ncbi:hypothetical protein HRbin36_02525 [bacterium HR36]|nr:hypothetical protein HRbin36_02525 [bacterium HR36]